MSVSHEAIAEKMWLSQMNIWFLKTEIYYNEENTRGRPWSMSRSKGEGSEKVRQFVTGGRGQKSSKIAWHTLWTAPNWNGE